MKKIIGVLLIIAGIVGGLICICKNIKRDLIPSFLF